jgi:hypothetical protein
MIKVSLYACCAVALVLTATAFAQQKKTIQVRVAEGKTISAVVDDQGPFPAEDARVKIEVAGILVMLEKERKEPQLVWNFSFRSKVNQSISGVKVDDVTKDPVASLVTDGHPVLKESVWRGTAPPIAINKQMTPWLYDSKPEIRVFRFTVRYQDESEIILHQLAFYPVSAKETVRTHAEKLRTGG